MHGRFSDRVTADADEHRGIRAGFRFLLGDPVLRTITLAWVVLLAGVGPMLVAELPLARSFGVGSTGYGLLAASWGAGAIAGSFLGQRLGSRRERAVMIASAVGMAAGFAVIGVAGWFAMVLFGMAFAGIAEGAGSVAEQGIVQRRTPDAVPVTGDRGQRGRPAGRVRGLVRLRVADPSHRRRAGHVRHRRRGVHCRGGDPRARNASV